MPSVYVSLHYVKLPINVKIPITLWASSLENLSQEVCEQQRRRPTCTSAQPDQRLFYSHFGKYHIKTCYEQNFNFLTGPCS